MPTTTSIQIYKMSNFVSYARLTDFTTLDHVQVGNLGVNFSFTP